MNGLGSVSLAAWREEERLRLQKIQTYAGIASVVLLAYLLLTRR